MTFPTEPVPSQNTPTTDDSFFVDPDPTSQGEVAPSNDATQHEVFEITNGQDDDEEEEGEEWPEAFFCQRTNVLMTDPLVGPDGSSIDRSAVTEGELTTYFPNRALQAIVEETISLRQHPFRAGLKQLQQSVSQGLSTLLSDWNSHESLFRPLNDAFYCPITYNPMHQPVIDPEGNTFERVAIENWIRVNQNSPITRTNLRINQLYPNTAMQKLLQEEKEKPEDQMHPTIRKWKDEPIPASTDMELGGGQVVAQQHNQGQQQQQQQQQGSTLFIIISAHGIVSYPTTPVELVERDAALRRTLDRLFGVFIAGGCLCFAFFCMLAYLVSGMTFFLIFFVLTVSLALFKLFVLRRRSF